MNLFGLYISNIDLQNATDGVAKKILMQIKAFNQSGVEIKAVNTGVIYHTKFGQKVCSRLPFFPAYEKWSEIDVSKCDFLYIRKAHFDIAFYRFLKRAKGLGVKKIVLELPTYPYDKELSKRKSNYPYLWKDRVYRKLLHIYIDLITTYSTDELIFGVPAMHIVNGIDFDRIKERNILESSKHELHLLGVANMSFWHGYDRVINGLADYYHKDVKTKVVLHLVGQGGETSYYKDLVRKHNLEQYVIFHGKMSGMQLDSMYECCDIGVCSLGCHRKNLKLSSELKTREYTAKGLPMIASCPIDVFQEKEFDFIKMEPDNDTPINISEVEEWYDTLISKTKTVKILSHKIRESAALVCDINRTIVPVVQYLQGN